MWGGNIEQLCVWSQLGICVDCWSGLLVGCFLLQGLWGRNPQTVNVITKWSVLCEILGHFSKRWTNFTSGNVSMTPCYSGFPGGSMVKNQPANVGDVGSIPRSEWSPEEGNDNPLQVFLAWEIPGIEQPGGLQSMG